ncbi:glycosyltransferase family 4 protein [Dyella humi]|uniref:Glycosyltransferase family 4 protein n=1 Tax=Dyella humi TaxID=1770547 RepID=A0ABW8IM68_9GAMM
MPDSVNLVRDLLADVVPAERVMSWESVGPTASMVEDNRSRNLAAEALREAFLESLNADVIFTASMVDGWVDSVVTSVPERSRALQVAVLFDLIPLVMPDRYLVKDDLKAWYMRKLEHLQRCDLLLGISESTCREAIQLLKLDERRIVNISAAVGDEFVRLPTQVTATSVGRKYGVHRNFVMYAGGFDHRKNLSALIAAYSGLSESVRKSHQLVFVGNIDTKEHNELSVVRDSVGLARDELVFTGFVSNAELIKLYNACAVYIFPSLHEGFGLPALEAMSCGAIVLGANTTSLPEVIGLTEALFDPSDMASISSKLLQGLTDEAFRNRFREHAAVHTKKFSWALSASAAWSAIEQALRVQQLQKPATPLGQDAGGRRVAVLTAGEFSSQALDALGFGPLATLQVDVIHDDDGSAEAKFVWQPRPANWCRRKLSDFNQVAYDEVVVQICDVPATAYLLSAVKDRNATLLLKDASVAQALNELQFVDRPLLASIIYGARGYQALERLAGPVSAASFEDLDSTDVAYGHAGWVSLPIAHRDEVQVARYREMRSLIRRLAQVPGIPQWNPADISRLAMAVARNRPVNTRQRSMFVDISHLVIEDAKTGIQRVVRHIVAELLSAPPSGFKVEPVYIKADGVFRYARNYCNGRFFPELSLPGDAPVAFQPGDVFVGLDLAAHLVPYLRETYEWMRSRGVAVNFVVYDLLPLLRPDCFDEAGLPTFRRWYEVIAELSDGIVCISRTVADELKQWLHQAMPVRGRPLKVGYFHLGADLAPGTAADGLDETLPFDLGRRPTFLMVGTIEPRKGHAQALEAFDVLWDTGHDVNLVLIGKAGWRVEELVSRLRNHPKNGSRLFWMETADDTQLIAMYHRSSALLAASEGEGFGLPLIEAAQYRLSIIARDLPVFLEVAGEHAFYFSGMEPGALAGSIKQWLVLQAGDKVPRSADMPWITWRQSAQQLEEVAVMEHWYYSWVPSMLRRFAASDYRAQSSAGDLIKGRRRSNGLPGVLYATPPFEVVSGTYELAITGERSSEVGTAWVDVEARDGSWRLASGPLTAGEGKIGSLQISLKEDVADFRIRIMTDGEANMEFWSLELTPVAGGGCSSASCWTMPST